jgi:hypothetical protein
MLRPESSIIMCTYVGLKKQQEQLPIQFILERLWEGASVVLTGETSHTYYNKNTMLLITLYRIFLWRGLGSILCHVFVESEPRDLP